MTSNEKVRLYVSETERQTKRRKDRDRTIKFDRESGRGHGKWKDGGETDN